MENMHFSSCPERCWRLPQLNRSWVQLPRFVLCLLLLLFATLGQSAVAADTGYSVEVAVNGQAPAEKTSACQVAMRIVLLRNSGDKTLLNRDDIRQALNSAETYVQQYSYRVPAAGEKITGDTPLTNRVRESSEATHLLGIQFSAVAINGLINGQAAATQENSDSGVPAESAAATSAVVWLLIEDGSKATMIGGKVGVNIIERAREIAGGAGQSLIFPTLDALDRQSLSAEDIRTGNQARILAAAERYQQPVILTGLLSRSNGRSWVANWNRYQDDVVENLTSESASLDQSLQQGINWLAPAASIDSAAGGLPGGAFGNSQSEGLIWISSVNTPQRYAAVLQLFNAVDTVELVSPREVLDSGILFAVSPRSAVNGAIQSAAQVNWLRSTSLAAPVAGGSSDLSSIRQADAFFEYLQ